MFRIVIAEPDDALSVWLADAFAPEQGFEIVGRAQDSRSALEMTRRAHPNVVLVDVDIVMPPHNGLTLVAAIRDAMPETLVLVLAGEMVRETAHAAFAAGAAGVFAKDGSAQILHPGLAASYPGGGWDEPSTSAEKPLPRAAHQMAPPVGVPAAARRGAAHVSRELWSSKWSAALRQAPTTYSVRSQLSYDGSAL